MRYGSRVFAALILTVAPLLAVTTPTAATAVAADTRPPSAPTGLRVERVSFTEATFRWSPSTDDSGWLQYEVEVEALPTYLQSYAALEPTITFTNLPQGKTFTASVVAVDAARNRSAPVSVQFTTPIDTTIPTAPSNLRAVRSNGVLTAVEWDRSTDNSPLTYYLFADGNRVFGTTGTSASVDALLLSFCCIEPGSTNTLTVRAIDVGDHLSPPSNALTVTFPG